VRCATSANRSCSTVAPRFYRCYETSDGKYVAVGAIEPQFFAALLIGLGLSPDEVPGQLDSGSYQQMYDVFAERFASRTRDEWKQVFAGTVTVLAYPLEKYPDQRKRTDSRRAAEIRV
jgi:crotonobetainyl-CoA:carnitine CoA-transferase CaiB-like acyl-CoA transferase